MLQSKNFKYGYKYLNDQQVEELIKYSEDLKIQLKSKIEHLKSIEDEYLQQTNSPTEIKEMANYFANFNLDYVNIEQDLNTLDFMEQEYQTPSDDQDIDLSDPITIQGKEYPLPKKIHAEKWDHEKVKHYRSIVRTLEQKEIIRSSFINDHPLKPVYQGLDFYTTEAREKVIIQFTSDYTVHKIDTYGNNFAPVNMVHKIKQLQLEDIHTDVLRPVYKKQYHKVTPRLFQSNMGPHVTLMVESDTPYTIIIKEI